MLWRCQESQEFKPLYETFLVHRLGSQLCKTPTGIRLAREPTWLTWPHSSLLRHANLFGQTSFSCAIFQDKVVQRSRVDTLGHIDPEKCILWIFFASRDVHIFQTFWNIYYVSQRLTRSDDAKKNIRFSKFVKKLVLKRKIFTGYDFVMNFPRIW